jgi:hypothetical protein
VAKVTLIITVHDKTTKQLRELVSQWDRETDGVPIAPAYVDAFDVIDYLVNSSRATPDYTIDTMTMED